MQCETCKWWAYGATVSGDYRRCGHPVLRRQPGLRPADANDDGVQTACGHVWTGPKFGCVHWDAKT